MTHNPAALFAAIGRANLAWYGSWIALSARTCEHARDMMHAALGAFAMRPLPASEAAALCCLVAEYANDMEPIR